MLPAVYSSERNILFGLSSLSRNTIVENLRRKSAPRTQMK